MGRPVWTDLLDPDEPTLRAGLPDEVRVDALNELLRPADEEGARVRPSIKSHGRYVIGLLLVAVAVPDEDVVFYQEVDFVLTRDRIVTIRKTPGARPPFDPARVEEVCDLHGRNLAPGMIAYFLVDEIAERCLDLLDDLDDEIDELEEHVDRWPAEKSRQRISELRHDLLHIRKTLGPTRDAVREIVDGRVDVESRLPFAREVFPRELERQFATTYDKLLRATESIEFARDLLAAVRDYQQARVAIDQNEATKKLTAIASILLVPTFIVGLYGQNFVHTPEYHWRFGYAWSWGLIITATIAQLVYFRRKRWI
ncbi:MAG TPA: magnesium transporter CorA family protein [Gaiellaceae bacterium]|nr:magnesium transporter CorA family protein [Gaiellaceae bacterium]